MNVIDDQTTQISSHYPYSRGEELSNSISHGIGVGFSITALVVLVNMSSGIGDIMRVVSFSIYGSCLTLLYLSSTFYHAVSTPRLKRLFRVFDHATIFLLIAGTYTPVCLVSLKGGWGWTLFGLIWGVAVFGIILEVFFMDRFKKITLTTYLTMGWLGVIAIKPIIEVMPGGALIWLAVGGVAYTGGVAFYVWKKLPFNHTIWHLFVIAGSACHFFAFYFYLLH
jgi:hemolysin III